MEQENINLNETHADAKPVLCVGCRVILTKFDAEEGFPTSKYGTVIFDNEENYYRKTINVKMDSGETCYSVPKWSVGVLGNHA